MGYWRGKVVVVTGASAGLGEAIARAAAERGARVVLASRDVEQLARVEQVIRSRGGEATAMPTDVTCDDQTEALFQRTRETFGRLDALINNAGRSMRRAVLDTTVDDFQSLMDLNLLGVVRCTRAAAAELLAARGHLVNIGSLASKSAARWMGAYSATKFALAAYTQQLRLELSPQGLHVMLVCPGPIARDEPRDRPAHETEGLPDAAVGPGAGVRVRAISPDKLAEKILRGCERRQGELIAPGAARLVFALSQLSPRLADFLVRRTT